MAEPRYPGLALAFVGVASNALVIMVNGGYMPVWLPAYEASGLPGRSARSSHVPLPATLGSEFLLHLGPLGDLIPLPLPPFQNVASIGDLFLTAGLSFFLFSTVLSVPQNARDAIDAAKAARSTGTGAARPRDQRADRDPRSPERRGAGRRGGHGDADGAAAPWTLFPPGEAVSDAVLRQGTGLSPGLEEASVLERPRMLGGGSVAWRIPR